MLMLLALAAAIPLQPVEPMLDQARSMTTMQLADTLLSRIVPASSKASSIRKCWSLPRRS
ncbi:hypothetical protein [uncultured Sphingomonas sp.]|uniref:hypothetical protein n=1 Tax=uncultured Sphingomonas sp. TaxID=158754 RepID=UPI0025CD702B|nr:hypothetical protein [uncultured Sphingomonas sp.]